MADTVVGDIALLALERNDALSNTLSASTDDASEVGSCSP